MNSCIKLQPGEIYDLVVVRKSSFGVFLDGKTGNSNEDILLHNDQQLKDIDIGETVKVYLYLDPAKRLTASMRLPKFNEGDFGRLCVINKSKDGAFVDVGTERGVFMPFSQMYGRLEIGQKIWCLIYRDKTGRLAASMKVDEIIEASHIPANDVKRGDLVSGYVYKVLESGYLLYEDNKKNIIFVHKDETIEKNIKYGDKLEGRVSFVRQDGRLNMSTRHLKQVAIDEDAENILQFLHNRNGEMPYSDDTSADVIKEKFKISKASFKRAMGRLMKNELIEQRNDGWTILKKK